MSTNTLGPYHIIRELARSNDIVYEARDPATGGRVALKELQIPANLTGGARAERIARFRREAEAAARLNHTNIVRILDRNNHDRVQNRYYIAMEFLEGQSLRDVLRQRGALPLQESLRIATAVAEGLDCAHRNGVIHRDVKPDNVHLEPDGRVVITDFGIARLSFEPTLTADGQIFGTPSYMSPEQVAGKGKDGRDVDARSDLFSLGVMLYEMVSGRKPFTGDSVITITWNIMNQEPPSIPGVPDGINQVIRRAMAKDRDDRYRMASEMSEDLRLISQGQAPRFATVPLRGGPRAPAAAPPPPALRPAPPPVSYAPVSSGGAGRPMPQAYFGSGAPPRGPVPGARPMPGPLPGANGVPPGALPRGAVPTGGNGVAPTAALPPVYQRRYQRRSAAGSEFLWLLGWLGVAVIIGALIVGLVALVLRAMDQVNHNSQVTVNVQAFKAASDAAAAGRTEDALNQYLALADRPGPDQASAKKSAGALAQTLALQRYGKKKYEEAEKLARQSVTLDPDLAAGYYVLAQALAKQDRVDESVEAFDKVAPAAEATRKAGGTPAALEAARVALEETPAARAEVLYNDGARLVDKDPKKARERFQAVIAAMPAASDYARAARTQLALMETATDPLLPNTVDGVASGAGGSGSSVPGATPPGPSTLPPDPGGLAMPAPSPRRPNNPPEKDYAPGLDKIHL